MIKITITRDQSGNIVTFYVKGHAGIAPRGQDIVCAGVSALAQAALLGIKVHLNRDFQWRVAHGDIEMRLAGKPDALTNAVLETMVLGLLEIVRNYPKNIRMIEAKLDLGGEPNV
ncbi:ribosomal-processing cysteine protease Prp [Acetonema longum]|uniref:Ribosomal processing cysteine protease Prp n=1 Tax=Acetonema longum DSM 6540 TaxID=1009370 RepID=F7NHQ7_9FIRM|nr:ribosomal-processing cysteine protease Prp [Acetonema longum]EGO64432.1 hypothetical protein ALO_08023 [Acetonema longum DSM 6540]